MRGMCVWQEGIVGGNKQRPVRRMTQGMEAVGGDIGSGVLNFSRARIPTPMTLAAVVAIARGTFLDIEKASTVGAVIRRSTFLNKSRRRRVVTARGTVN